MGICCLGLLIVAGTVLLVFINVKEAQKRKAQKWVHGSARLAASRELDIYRPAPGSLVVGYDQRSRQLLALDQRKQEEHILVVGPTGRGKTTAIILPGLLTETGSRSLFAIDPKTELYSKTAGALSRNYQVWQFAPTSSASHHYNPLVHVHSMEDAQDLARAWIENTGQNTKTPFFERNVELIITAAVLHLCKLEPNAPFSRLADILCLPFPALVARLTSSPELAARNLAAPLLSGIAGSPQLIAGFCADLANRMLLLSDPVIRSVTSTNAIDFHEMVDPTRRPTALFLSVPMSQAQRIKPLSALFLMQMFRSFIRDAEWNSGQLALPIACYLDEFCNAGKIPHFENYIATLRSMRVSLLLAIQNFSQVDYVYARDITPTVLSNATTHLVFPGCGKEECEYYSARMGDTTVEFENRSVQYRDLIGTPGYMQQRVRRRLMTPDEVRTMPAGQIILLRGSSPPVLVQTLPYYQVPGLYQLANLPAPRLANTRVTTLTQAPKVTKKLVAPAPQIAQPIAQPPTSSSP